MLYHFFIFATEHKHENCSCLISRDVLFKFQPIVKLDVDDTFVRSTKEKFLDQAPIENKMSGDVLEVILKVVIVSSGLIGALGTVTNPISLSFFIKRCEKGVSRGLFIFLNVFDLLVCVSEVLALAFFHCKDPDCRV